MSPIDKIRTYHDELVAIRRDLHAHPELGLEEHRTAEIVAKTLEGWGIEVHRGVGRTGVVGVLRGRAGNRAVGLRADMDALPIEEISDAPHRSTIPGKAHSCGHDGHTTMLLGAARYLAETRDFDGTVHFIFQPGEEGCGGALEMIGDGLFERFPCDRVYGMHNRPGMAIGTYALSDGPAMAGGAFFDVTVTGKGAHGAQPQSGFDPVAAVCQIVSALQTVVARNLHPSDPAVLSITKLAGGDAYNVIPETATFGGTARFFRREVGEATEAAVRRVIENVAVGLGCRAEIDWRVIFAPTINDSEAAAAGLAAMQDLAAPEMIDPAKPPSMGSEDFSFMMEKVPGAYVLVGNGDSAGLHNPKYMFNDEAIPFGSALYARLVERGA